MCQAKKKLPKTSYLKLDYKSMTSVLQSNKCEHLRVKTSYYQWQNNNNNNNNNNKTKKLLLINLFHEDNSQII